MSSPDDLLRPIEVSREYHIGIVRLQRMIRAREIGYVPVGKVKKLIPRREVHAWIERTTVQPTSAS